MARKSKGTDETNKGDVIISHDDKVKFKVEYGSNWDEKKPKHMKEGDVVVISESHANTLVAKGVGKIVEHLNDKRDKSLDGPKTKAEADKTKGKGKAKEDGAAE